MSLFKESHIEDRNPAFIKNYIPAMSYLFLIVLYCLLISYGFGPYITDDHGFRQTQTAITAQYFSGLHDFLFYITPVLGPPWSIPFEFPLYQGIVKFLYIITNFSLETCGRIVSIVFFLLCFWPINRILNFLAVT